jgi:zinc transporter, ZIP family
VFGILASSALVVGGALGSFWRPSDLVTGAMLAFASGTLISALAFELFPEADSRVAPPGEGEVARRGVGLALLAAIFASNFPEALVGAVAMRSQGRPAGYAVGLWGATAVLLTLAVVVGRQALAAAEPSTLGFPLAFAGGAVLASLADTLMPEAFERGRPVIAFATAAGFYVAFVLAEGW